MDYPLFKFGDFALVQGLEPYTAKNLFLVGGVRIRFRVHYGGLYKAWGVHTSKVAVIHTFKRNRL
jgi:hypothetical protein